MRLTLLFSIVLLFWRATTLAFHKIIRNDDFCGKKCWILNMIDHLRCCFNAQLSVIYIDGCKLWCAEFGKK